MQRCLLRIARNPVALTCHLLQQFAELPFSDETGRGAGDLGYVSEGRHLSDGTMLYNTDRHCVCSLDADADSFTCPVTTERGGKRPLYDCVLESPAFKRGMEATAQAELQATASDLPTLKPRAHLCFWINLNIHNALVVHGHCVFRPVGVITFCGSSTSSSVTVRDFQYGATCALCAVLRLGLVLFRVHPQLPS